LKITEIILTTFLATLTGTTMITLYTSLNIEDAIETILVMGILQFLMTVTLGIIIGIREHGDYYGKSLQHREASYKYLRITHSIQEQLSLRLSDRVNDTIFVNKMIKNYDELMMSPLVISKDTSDRYLEATKNNNIYKPSIIGDIENIEITDVNDTYHVNSDSSDPVDNKDINNMQKYEFDRWAQSF
jgi:hypothetical protein